MQKSYLIMIKEGLELCQDPSDIVLCLTVCIECCFVTVEFHYTSPRCCKMGSK